MFDERGATTWSRRTLLKAVAAGAISPGVVGCYQRAPDDGRIHLTYWEKWERFERQAMEAVVRDFNASQDRIRVHYTPVGAIDRKMMVATAGGDPPDIGGLWEGNLATFASHHLAEPLDPLMKRDGWTRDRWTKVYADICTYNDTMYAFPTAPSATALHWNKALFDEAGLDPNRPPRTVEELDEYNDRLTKVDSNGNILRMGHLPYERVHSWFLWAYPYWWGGKLITDGRISADDPRTVRCYDWIASYSKKYGPDKIQRFGSGFGTFASPQNPFFSGRLAMIIQGVWLHNYIEQYAPSMQWGAAAWPQAPGGPANFSSAGTDIIILPVGLPENRREAAWTFMKYIASQPAMEKFCRGQKKHTPLRRTSAEFIRNHPHPHIETFIELAKSDAVVRPLGIGIWNQYQHEMNAAVQSVVLLEKTGAEALGHVQKRMERAFQRHKESKALRGEEVNV